jgi:hypothetical protein
VTVRKPPPGRTHPAHRRGPAGPGHGHRWQALSRRYRFHEGHRSPCAQAASCSHGFPMAPSSSASIFAAIASPGRSPEEIANRELGTRAVAASTKTIEPPSPAVSATAQAIRRAPRKTGSKPDHQSSSVTSETVAKPRPQLAPVMTYTRSRNPSPCGQSRKARALVTSCNRMHRKF